jgi:hypothetical protein
MLMFGVVLAALLVVPGAAMAKSHDRNHDGIPDKWEKRFHLSTTRNAAKADPDRDWLNNLGEFKSHTNPRKADTNGNGVNDANDDTDGDGVDNQDEMNQGTNPDDQDSNNDGVKDGHELSGTVVGFVEDSANPGTGTLTIQLADNSQVSGKVDSSTKIECDGTDQQSGRHEKDGGGDSGSSGSGADDGANHDANGDSGDDGPNGDANDNDGDDTGSSASCSTADLTPGAVVREADLQGTGDQAVFSKVELQK